MTLYEITLTTVVVFYVSGRVVSYVLWRRLRPSWMNRR